MAPKDTQRPSKDDGTRALALIRALVASLSSSARAIESSTGLTNAQLFLLRQAANHDTISINELALLARTRQNGVSAVVAKLVHAGLLEKARSSADRRRASVTVTAKGRRALMEAPESPTEVLIDGLDALTPREIRALIAGLAALTTTLGLEAEAAPMLFERPSRIQRAGSIRGR